jgi:hypothetical protein
MICWERWRRQHGRPTDTSTARTLATQVLGTFLFVAFSRILFVETDLHLAASSCAPSSPVRAAAAPRICAPI